MIEEHIFQLDRIGLAEVFSCKARSPKSRLGVQYVSTTLIPLDTFHFIEKLSSEGITKPAINTVALFWFSLMSQSQQHYLIDSFIQVRGEKTKYYSNIEDRIYYSWVKPFLENNLNQQPLLKYIKKIKGDQPNYLVPLLAISIYFFIEHLRTNSNYYAIFKTLHQDYQYQVMDLTPTTQDINSYTYICIMKNSQYNNRLLIKVGEANNYFERIDQLVKTVLKKLPGFEFHELILLQTKYRLALEMYLKVILQQYGALPILNINDIAGKTELFLIDTNKLGYLIPRHHFTKIKYMVEAISIGHVWSALDLKNAVIEYSIQDSFLPTIYLIMPNGVEDHTAFNSHIIKESVFLSQLSKLFS